MGRKDHPLMPFTLQIPLSASILKSASQGLGYPLHFQHNAYNNSTYLYISSLKVNSDNPKPSWRAPASPESLRCCNVPVCRQVSSPVSLWSSGQGSVRWWSLKRRWRSPRSCRCSSECADTCRTLYAPGQVKGEVKWTELHMQ